MKDMTAYAGRWVALIGEQVIGVGYTADEALQSGKDHQTEERAVLIFVEPAGSKRLRKGMTEWLRHTDAVRLVFEVAGSDIS